MPTATKPKPSQTNGRARQVKGWYLARGERDRYIISGLIAALIFFVIDVATGGGVVSAIGLGVVVGIVGVAISFAISRAIIASPRRRS
jgi:small-conductance mechanosensitive channel